MIWSKEGVERSHRPDMVGWDVHYLGDRGVRNKLLRALASEKMAQIWLIDYQHCNYLSLTLLYILLDLVQRLSSIFAQYSFSQLLLMS